MACTTTTRTDQGSTADDTLMAKQPRSPQFRRLQPFSECRDSPRPTIVETGGPSHGGKQARIALRVQKPLPPKTSRKKLTAPREGKRPDMLVTPL